MPSTSGCISDLSASLQFGQVVRGGASDACDRSQQPLLLTGACFCGGSAGSRHTARRQLPCLRSASLVPNMTWRSGHSPGTASCWLWLWHGIQMARRPRASRTAGGRGQHPACRVAAPRRRHPYLAAAVHPPCAEQAARFPRQHSIACDRYVKLVILGNQPPTIPAFRIRVQTRPPDEGQRPAALSAGRPPSAHARLQVPQPAAARRPLLESATRHHAGRRGARSAAAGLRPLETCSRQPARGGPSPRRTAARAAAGGAEASAGQQRQPRCRQPARGSRWQCCRATGRGCGSA